MDLLVSDGALQAVERAILVLLLLLGAACGVIFLRRWKAIGKACDEALRWRGRVEKDLAEDVERRALPGKALIGDAGSADRILEVALKNAHLCPEALEQLLEAQEARERERLERGASFLGTVGANAPFLGLTGTVLGILAAFRRMAEEGGGGSDVMSAIAGALIATAAGLLVAIPAVVLYNLLRARIKKTLNVLGQVRGLLMARSLQATVPAGGPDGF